MIARLLRWLPLSLALHVAVLAATFFVPGEALLPPLFVDLTLSSPAVDPASPRAGSGSPARTPGASRPAQSRPADRPAVGSPAPPTAEPPAASAPPGATVPEAPPTAPAASPAPTPEPSVVPPPNAVAEANGWAPSSTRAAVTSSAPLPAVAPAPPVDVASGLPGATEGTARGTGGGAGSTTSSAGTASLDSAGAGGAPASAGEGRGLGDGALALAVPGDSGGVYASYLALLRRRVQEVVTYPAAARRRGLSGTVHLEIALDPSGFISDVTLARSSSHAVLDAAAVDGVRSLGRVPFPSDVRARALRVRLPVVFELR